MLFLGNCITTVDEGMWDATEMAQLIENSKPGAEVALLLPYVPEELRKPMLFDNSDRFSFGRNGRIVWFHDDETDIHYFYQS
jgi:hypothetical protein